MKYKRIKIYFHIPFSMYFIGKKDMEPLSWASGSIWSKLLVFRKDFNPADGTYSFRDLQISNSSINMKIYEKIRMLIDESHKMPDYLKQEILENEMKNLM